MKFFEENKWNTGYFGIDTYFVTDDILGDPYFSNVSIHKQL